MMGAVGTISVRPKTEAVLAKIGSRRPRQPRSITRICFLFLLLVTVLALIRGGIPPYYDDIRGYERRLAQHNLSLPFPEGEDGLYLRIPGYLWGHGITGDVRISFPLFSFKLLTICLRTGYWCRIWRISPERIPLNAFISGPAAGGPISLPPSSSASHNGTQQRQQNPPTSNTRRMVGDRPS